MNIREWLEFELACYDVAVQHINYYTTRNSPTHFFVVAYEKLSHIEYE